jgi:hypothetical protein
MMCTPLCATRANASGTTHSRLGADGGLAHTFNATGYLQHKHAQHRIHMPILWLRVPSHLHTQWSSTRIKSAPLDARKPRCTPNAARTCTKQQRQQQPRVTQQQQTQQAWQPQTWSTTLAYKAPKKRWKAGKKGCDSIRPARSARSVASCVHTGNDVSAWKVPTTDSKSFGDTSPAWMRSGHTHIHINTHTYAHTPTHQHASACIRKHKHTHSANTQAYTGHHLSCLHMRGRPPKTGQRSRSTKTASG